MTKIYKVKTISEFHRTRQLPAPQHPLIIVIDYAAVQMLPKYEDITWVFDFYLSP